ncbi:hypothetical protein MMPV_003114 [Pyropia vietnamensis]
MSPAVAAAATAAGAAAVLPPAAAQRPSLSAVAVAVGGGDELEAVRQAPAAAPVDGDPIPPSPRRCSFDSVAASEDPLADSHVEAGETSEAGGPTSPFSPFSPATTTVLHLTATVCLALAAAGLAAFGIGTAVTARAWKQGGHGGAHGGPAVAALLLVAASLLGVTAGLGAAATVTAQRPRGLLLGRSFAYAAGSSGVVLAAVSAGSAITAAVVGRYGGVASWAFGLVAALAATVGGMVLLDAWRVLRAVPAEGGCLEREEWESNSSLDSKDGGEGARWRALPGGHG